MAKKNVTLKGKTKATFYLSDRVQARLEDAVYKLKKTAPDLKRGINKSLVLEAALVYVLAELEEQLDDERKPTLLAFID